MVDNPPKVKPIGFPDEFGLKHTLANAVQKLRCDIFSLPEGPAVNAFSQVICMIRSRQSVGNVAAIRDERVFTNFDNACRIMMYARPYGSEVYKQMPVCWTSIRYHHEEMVLIRIVRRPAWN